jgi:hypothetical protein
MTISVQLLLTIAFQFSLFPDGNRELIQPAKPEMAVPSGLPVTRPKFYWRNIAISLRT